MVDLPRHEFSATEERAMRARNRHFSSLPVSGNVDDRRSETRAQANARMGDETVDDFVGQKPNDRVSDGFADLGDSPLAKAAGIDHIGGE